MIQMSASVVVWTGGRLTNRPWDKRDEKGQVDGLRLCVNHKSLSFLRGRQSSSLSWFVRPDVHVAVRYVA